MRAKKVVASAVLLFGAVLVFSCFISVFSDGSLFVSGAPDKIVNRS